MGFCGVETTASRDGMEEIAMLYPRTGKNTHTKHYILHLTNYNLFNLFKCISIVGLYLCI